MPTPSPAAVAGISADVDHHVFQLLLLRCLLARGESKRTKFRDNFAGKEVRVVFQGVQAWDAHIVGLERARCKRFERLEVSAFDLRDRYQVNHYILVLELPRLLHGLE